MWKIFFVETSLLALSLVSTAWGLLLIAARSMCCLVRFFVVIWAGVDIGVSLSDEKAKYSADGGYSWDWTGGALLWKALASANQGKNRVASLLPCLMVTWRSPDADLNIVPLSVSHQIVLQLAVLSESHIFGGCNLTLLYRYFDQNELWREGFKFLSFLLWLKEIK